MIPRTGSTDSVKASLGLHCDAEGGICEQPRSMFDTSLLVGPGQANKRRLKYRRRKQTRGLSGVGAIL